MPVFDTYSWRKKRAEQVEPDVYQYDHVPAELRVQVRHILDAALGAYVHDPHSGSKHNNGFLQELHDLLLRETARLHLSRERVSPKSDILEAVTGSLASVDEWLDVVEICFFAIDHVVRSWPQDACKDRGITQDPEDAINELNTRLRRAGFGYQFEAGRIIRVDSQYLHSEVVKPALVLLADPRFKGAREEFLSAHAHYRAGGHEEAIVDANRAFESTMKAICVIKDWQYKDGARASDLIKLIRANSLLPDLSRPVIRPAHRDPEVRSTECSKQCRWARAGGNTQTDTGVYCGLRTAPRRGEHPSAGGGAQS